MIVVRGIYFVIIKYMLELIGNTPLISLSKISREFSNRIRIMAKAEWFNPGGSVKDRAAYSIIKAGEKTGRLTHKKIILDATSGNTGIAYAMIGAAKGYRVKLCVPANAGEHTIKILKIYGASVVRTDPLKGSDGAILEARRLYKGSPDIYFYADQYNNEANWQAHYETTALEIIKQTDGKVTHFVAGLGTSGTFIGTGRRLREFNPDIKLISVQPDSPLHGLEGLKHIQTSIVPGIYDPNFADMNINISTEEAYECVKRLAKIEALLVGISSGAALSASLKIAASITDGFIVTVFPDGGNRYLNEEFWSNEDTTYRAIAM